MSSCRREQRAWYVYDWANSAFSTTVVSVLFGPYLTELVRVAAGPSGRLEIIGFAIDYRAVWEWLIALSALTQALAMPLVGSFRIGALAITVFFVVGFGILARVNLRRGAAMAGNDLPPG